MYVLSRPGMLPNGGYAGSSYCNISKDSTNLDKNIGERKKHHERDVGYSHSHDDTLCQILNLQQATQGLCASALGLSPVQHCSEHPRASLVEFSLHGH
jgi:hypothetical protein